ncbi:Putative lipoprotein/NMB1162 [Pandoraea terrae]|uniref:Lipoprotein/NMB1162 n=1 Tax=Pandoraea terrae TaxID=1537710 RepID=A0A5E4YKL8_9BURK|nr:DUF799 domain-containing protein [Pandoraea terrae]VVE49087.1 Putative lipoprotein/NMB1162 [Pandoraea terrae]
MLKSVLKLLSALSVTALVAGCATPAAQIDYAAFKESRPRSILVLPPLNDSPEVEATYSFLSQMTYPLAESGYYVMPVTLVEETFKQNGLTTAGDIHEVAPGKLREIFGADAALYVTVQEYGSRYRVLDSVVEVTANAKLVDLKSGKALWTGTASASSKEEQQNSGGGGLIGILVSAALQQIVNNVSDAGHRIAGITSRRLLSASRENGILYGPRSPRYETD